jgi:hypothetical protein
MLDVEGSYLAECFWPGVTPEAVQAADLRARRRVAQLHEEGFPLRYLGSLVVPGDEVVVFEFAAPSQEIVAQLCLEAELPVDRVVESVRLGKVGQTHGEAAGGGGRGPERDGAAGET